MKTPRKTMAKASTHNATHGVRSRNSGIADPNKRKSFNDDEDDDLDLSLDEDLDDLGYNDFDEEDEY